MKRSSFLKSLFVLPFIKCFLENAEKTKCCQDGEYLTEDGQCQSLANNIERDRYFGDGDKVAIDNLEKPKESFVASTNDHTEMTGTAYYENGCMYIDGVCGSVAGYRVVYDPCGDSNILKNKA